MLLRSFSLALLCSAIGIQSVQSWSTQGCAYISPSLLRSSAGLCSAKVSQGGVLKLRAEDHASPDQGQLVCRRSLTKDILRGVGAAVVFQTVVNSNVALASETPPTNSATGAAKLGPPKKIYKDIFEEERELAKLREEEFQAEQKKKKEAEIRALNDQFSVIKKGRVDLEKDIKEAIKKLNVDSEDALAWDEIRKSARLYDTAIRKDGFYVISEALKKNKINFDRKQADSFANEFKEGLKGLDKAASKKNVEGAQKKLDEALQALDSWLSLQPELSV